jgi:hypothetical protein
MQMSGTWGVGVGIGAYPKLHPPIVKVRTGPLKKELCAAAATGSRVTAAASVRLRNDIEVVKRGRLVPAES